MDKQDSKDRELLSAAVDGELSEFELRRFLQRLESTDAEERDELLGDISRWALIGDVLRKDEDVAVVSSTGSLVGRVRAHIQLEPVEFQVATSADAASVSTPRGRPSWLKTLGGLSVAATVAAVVVLGYQVGVPHGSDLAAEDGQLAVNVDLEADDDEAHGAYVSPKAVQRIQPYWQTGGSNGANGFDLVSAESVKSIDGLRMVSDPMSQQYSAYFILHDTMSAYQQNALLPMTRIMDMPLEPSKH